MTSDPGQPARATMMKEGAGKRLKRRYREEGRFRLYGASAIVFAIAALAVLLVSIVGEALSAFTKHELVLDVTLDPALIDPTGARDPAEIGASVSMFSDVFRGELRERFPEAADDRALRRQLARMVSTLSGEGLAGQVSADPALIGQTIRARAPVSDLIDLYLKGLITQERVIAGDVAAEVQRATDGTLTVRAPGGFASVHADMVERVREQAVVHEDAAILAEASIVRADERLAAAEARRAEMLAADEYANFTAAEDYAATGDARQVALARAAGRDLQAGESDSLRRALAEELSRQAGIAEDEAAELLKRGELFSSRAAAALLRGEPIAETRRIQAETAFLAADRRQVDAALLRQRAQALESAALGSVPIMPLLAETALVLGRPVGPLAEVAAVESTGLSGAALREAVLAMNAVEMAAADAAVADQELRIAALERAAEALRAGSPERAEMLIAEAIPSAKSRLARLARESAARREARESLEGRGTAAPLAPAEPVDPVVDPDAPPVDPPAPVDVAAFTTTEAAAQLGLDLGGPLAVAFALGEVDGAGPRGPVKALMAAHAARDGADARRDREVLVRKRDRETQAAQALRAQIASPGASLTLDEFAPSLLVEIDGGVIKARSASPDAIDGVELIPLETGSGAAAGAWTLRELSTGEGDRLVSDRQAAWANALRASGEIERRVNFDLITKADSTYPELAGLAAALAGSFWIMAVTLLLSLPIGVMAAIYLEEFAPRNGFTDFIEVNINNLAAVPSIVFGLLGAAVFINFFDLPRSAPVVGGLVLSLITLPTIIIATRAALGAVPPSIREGALAVGASLPQTVFHHVLPLAAPGILTGAIIGLARALGETAPLLLIGMVAFVADPPDGMFDSATALPVLVYKWSSAAERAWQPMTSAAIIILLLFMFAMNALAVYLRRRLERRW